MFTYLFINLDFMKEQLTDIFKDCGLQFLSCNDDYALFVVEKISPAAFNDFAFFVECQSCDVNIDQNLEFGNNGGLEIEISY